MSANKDFTKFMGTEAGQAWLNENYKTNHELNPNEHRMGQSPDAPPYTPVDTAYSKPKKEYTGSLQPQRALTTKQEKEGWGWKNLGGNRKSKKNKKTEKRKTGKGKISKTGKGKISKTRSIRKKQKEHNRWNVAR